jgi:L-alanine-DL-glutamate epimerase-like enolase superfamily enzyme
MDVVLSSFIDGAVGRAHATHMAAALGCIDRAQGLATGTLLKNDVATAPFMPKAGEISLLEEPGLGIGQLIKDNAAVG